MSGFSKIELDLIDCKMLNSTRLHYFINELFAVSLSRRISCDCNYYCCAIGYSQIKYKPIVTNLLHDVL